MTNAAAHMIQQTKNWQFSDGFEIPITVKAPTDGAR